MSKPISAVKGPRKPVRGSAFSIIDKIEARRMDMGLSCAEVARRARCTENTLWLYLHARREPELDTIRRVVAALGLSLDLIVE